jgi:benzoyl-CoA reductase/2-hydroxyglutaryl-CoA dehydratase subunit BcrC/BadD/HgdB
MPLLYFQKKLKSLMQDYYQNLQSPVAWCTSAGPTEVLRALGFQVYFPENHGALLGASRTAGKYIPRAHQAGFNGEICSYLTADIGAWLVGETPLTVAYGLPSIPKPDLIVFNTNQCREVAEWFNYFGREYHCPVVGIYPPRYLETVTPGDIDHVVRQLEALIVAGSDIVGHPLDEDRLSETVRLSYDASCRWRDVLNMAQASPAPLTFFDGCILMAPIVVMRGTEICLRFYNSLLDELKQRVDQKIGQVPDEQVRIYWDGMPVWGRLRFLAETFAENQAAVVASTYCNSWIFDRFNPEKPLESIAEAYTRIFINRGENAKLEILTRLAEQFRVDGVVFHDSKTCFNNANSRFGLPKRFQAATRIPTLTIDGDLNDLRFFSDGQTKTRLETFIEQLKVRSRQKGQT